jgi:hypothetical protein
MHLEALNGVRLNGEGVSLGANWYAQSYGGRVAGSGGISFDELLTTAGPVRNGVAHVVEGFYGSGSVIPFSLGVPFHIRLSVGVDGDCGPYDTYFAECTQSDVRHIEYHIFEADGTTPVEIIEDVPLPAAVPEPRSTTAVLTCLGLFAAFCNRRLVY